MEVTFPPNSSALVKMLGQFPHLAKKAADKAMAKEITANDDRES